MRKRFDVYIRDAKDGLVKFHCEALETEARGKDNIIETNTYLVSKMGSTFYGLRQGIKGRELWEIEFSERQVLKPPFTFQGEFISKLRDVEDDWIEDYSS
jgi:hypothetical protein